MQFDSFTYFAFLPLVLAAHWVLPDRAVRARNAVLLAASYVFYGWWDPRFLGLIVLSSSVDYAVGRGLARSRRRRARRALLGASLAANLGLLGVYKYFDFFAESFAELLTALGVRVDAVTLGLVLPVGISFYTFQTLSHTIDAYRRRIEPADDPLAFFTFVAFFPQLVAGPIERARSLLPQFERPRAFDADRALCGARLVLWGLFKKVVVADGCGVQVDRVFAAQGEMSSAALALGAVWFAFQIYGDFSGYSDIAIGTARLFGVELMRNFATPYFSRDIAEFWRRWHVSLSTWFRDYVYVPLGGSRGATPRVVRNVFVVFLVSGLWHGASWTFVAWGLLNALYFVPLLLRGRNRAHLDTVAEGRALPTLREVGQVALTFTATCVAWVFFRAASIGDAFAYLGRALTEGSLDLPSGLRDPVPWVLVLVVLDWVGRREENPLELTRLPAPLRRAAWFAAACAVLWFDSLDRSIPFIYFQF